MTAHKHGFTKLCYAFFIILGKKGVNYVVCKKSSKII